MILLKDVGKERFSSGLLGFLAGRDSETNKDRLTEEMSTEVERFMQHRSLRKEYFCTGFSKGGSFVQKHSRC